MTFLLLHQHDHHPELTYALPNHLELLQAIRTSIIDDTLLSDLCDSNMKYRPAPTVYELVSDTVPKFRKPVLSNLSTNLSAAENTVYCRQSYYYIALPPACHQ